MVAYGKSAHNSTTKVSFSNKMIRWVSTWQWSWWRSQNPCHNIPASQTL